MQKQMEVLAGGDSGFTQLFAVSTARLLVAHSVGSSYLSLAFPLALLRLLPGSALPASR
jgi:hypothetical protein